MSESDWNHVTHIGLGVGGTGGDQRPTVIKGKAALNAAMRTGKVSTERKVRSANNQGQSDGRRDAKVEKEEKLLPPVGLDDERRGVINDQIGQNKEFKNRASLATKSNISLAELTNLLTPHSKIPLVNGINFYLDKLQKAMTAEIKDKDRLGQPRQRPTKKAQREREATKKSAEATNKQAEATKKQAQPADDETKDAKEPVDDAEEAVEDAEEPAESANH